MPRYKLTIEYDGGPFVGWQRQANGMSVQQRLEEAVLAINGARAVIHGAGRTDAGVHALGQVAHVDLVRDWRGDRLRDAINAHLKPDPVAVIDARAVEETFEARFSAIRHEPAPAGAAMQVSAGSDLFIIPLEGVIDLDAALGRGSNEKILRELADPRLPELRAALGNQPLRPCR